MSLSDWNYITLAGTLLDSDGEPARGVIEFVPSSPLLNTINETTVVDVPFNMTLDEAGFFMVDLMATDTAGIEPLGWKWKITERIYGRADRSFYVSLPLATPIVEYVDLVASGVFNEFS